MMTSTPSPAPAAAVQRVSADDPEYRRLAGEEAEYWSQPRVGSLESLERCFADGPFERYVNRRFTGDPDLHWWDTIASAGPFSRGVVLGTSALTIEDEILASNPGLHLTFVDISPGALARRAEELGRKYPGRVETVTADLNFVELPRGEYDLVVSAAALHHVTNLEYVAEEIAAALRPGGRFFLQDYVGEPRFQFSAEKKRAFEAFHDDYLRRAMPARAPGVTWSDASDLSPFCGVRSDEVLSVLGGRLRAVDVHTAGALTVPLSRVSPVDKTPAPPPPLPRRVAESIDDWQRRRRGKLPRSHPNLPSDFFAELFALDAMLCDAQLLVPGVAFAIYEAR